MAFADFALIVLMLFVGYYLLVVAKKPLLSYTQNEFNDKIISIVSTALPFGLTPMKPSTTLAS